MWQASEGILAILAFMFTVGILSRFAFKKSRPRSRQRLDIAAQGSSNPLDESAAIEMHEAALNQGATASRRNAGKRPTAEEMASNKGILTP